MMGKIQKTDAAGKTVEAWWALLFAEGSLGRSLPKWGWPVIGGSVGLWVASATSWISSYGVAGWAATILLGALGFVWIAVGIDRLRARQAPIGSGTAPDFAAASELDEPAFTKLIDHRLAEFLEAKLRSEFATNAQLHDFDEKLSALSDKAEKERGSAKMVFEYAKKRNAAFQERIDEIAKGCADLEARIDRARSHDNDAIRSQFESVDQSFRALQNREGHARLFRDLEEQFEELAKPVNGGHGIADDAAWRGRLKVWRSTLDQWLVIADWYASGVKDTVLTTPEHLYEGEWTFDEPPLTANQIHRFKETAIWWANAKEEKPRVERALAAAAFDLPSSTRRLGSPPRLTEDR